MENIDLIEKVTRIEERSKSNTKRLDEHDEQLKELSQVYVALTQVNNKVENIEGDVCEIKSEIKKGKEQKGMKWDKLIDYLFYAILAFALFKLGLR